MNYSENHDPIRNSLENDNSQYYQNAKKSENNNRQSNMKHENKTLFPNNINQKSEGQSRLNYHSSPFIPKQQFPMMNDSKALRPDISGDSMNRMPSEYENQLYPQSANVNYDGFNSNMTNQCLYNPFDFMPFWYPLHNTGTPHSNYWPLMPGSNYIGVSNLGLSTSLEPNQNMFMVGKTSENPMNSKNSYNSAVSNLESNFSTFSLNSPQSKYQPNSQIIHTNRKNPQMMKNSGTMNNDAPAPGLHWNQFENHSFDTALQKGMKYNYSDHSNYIHSDQYKSEENERFQGILNCVSDTKLKKSLSDTMQNINPTQFDLSKITRARFFVIKSYSEDDLHRAIKYGVWCSTRNGNNKLDNAYRELNKIVPNQESGRLFLFFSVNGSGFFAGIAEMISIVNHEESCKFWSQNKWIGKFKIKWHYVKDVRNSNLRHIRSEANENKPVTNSRDVVEVTPFDNGIEFIKVFHHAKYETSVFDDFEHYERRENDPTLSVQ